MNALIEKIRSRGYWDVIIRPHDFVECRIPYENLQSIVERVQVRFRGWPVPFIGDPEPIQHGKDWIGQDVDAGRVSHYEAWRYWTSGQFNQLRSVSADWRQGSEEAIIPKGFSTIIEVWEILYYITEVYELAARLGLSGTSSDTVVISVSLFGLANRALVVGQNSRAEFLEPYWTSEESLTFEIALAGDVLVAQSREEAAKMARDFFARFGWQPALNQLLDHQRELTEYRL